MLALAKYALKGPYQAAAMVGMLVIVAVFFPLISGNPILSLMVTSVLILVACTLVGLIILTQGSISGLKAISVAIIGITLVAAVVLKKPGLGISIALAQWLPIVIMAQSLRTTKSLAAMLLVGVLLAGIGTGVQFLLWPELEAEWVQQLEIASRQLQESAAYRDTVVFDTLPLLIHWMVLSLGAFSYTMFVSILLLARWLQARIAESDGFSREFQAISLGKQASLAGAAVLMLGFWLDLDWIKSLALVVMAAFMYQGIAVVHARAAASKRKGLLIVLFYALLLIFPQVVVLTMIVGLLDNWLVFRKPKNIDIT